MSIHVTTGNKLDVVYELHGDKKVIVGLWWHKEGVMIPLPEPNGLLISLRSVLSSRQLQCPNCGGMQDRELGLCRFCNQRMCARCLAGPCAKSYHDSLLTNKEGNNAKVPK